MADYQELRNQFIKELDLEPCFVDTVFATLVGNRFPGDPLWVMIVAEPGSGKTEAIRCATGMVRGDLVEWRDKLTVNTLVSHFKTAEGKPSASLLPKLANKVFIVKDFSTIFSMQPRDQQAILGQLHACYDGNYGSSSGLPNDQIYDVKFGFLGVSNLLIDHHILFFRELGDRFLYHRPVLDCTNEVLERILNDSARADARRATLGTASRHLLKQEFKIPSVDRAALDTIKTLSREVARLRCPVIRHYYRRFVEVHPTPEQPSRIALQLKKLALGLCALDIDPIPILRRIAGDSIPPVRLSILKQLGDEPVEVETLLAPSGAVRQETIHDLKLLGIIRVEGKPAKVSLAAPLELTKKGAS